MIREDSLPAPLAEVLEAFGLPHASAQATRATSGLIQVTWLVTLVGGSRWVLQRAHPVFDPDGHGETLLGDIDAITTTLAAGGQVTPRLRRRPEGGLGFRDQEGKLWRVLSWLPGQTFDRVTGPRLAHSGARLVARFHALLANSSHTFAFSRPGAHDTRAHLARLAALAAAPEAAKVGDEIRRLADEILSDAQVRPELPDTPARITHGDLKISNLLFDQDAQAHALIDLDTIGRLTLAYELGDALRSWCNPRGEDVPVAHFDLEIFAATLEGYAEGARTLGFELAPGEAESFAPGIATVALELSARFCTDAFEDRYFGWDSTRFPSRREHNRVRAQGQLSLSRAARAARGEAEAVVQKVFGRPH